MSWKTVARRSGVLAIGFIAGAAIVLATVWLLDVREYRKTQADVDAARSRLADVDDLSTVFRDVSTSVEPSVVDIITRRTRPMPAAEGPAGSNVLEIGNGSGVIVDVDGSHGWIVTNNHVVTNATQIVITLSDGREIDNAHVIGTDPPTDLAVIEFSAPRLIAAEWGDSDRLAKGDWVLAFGSPFGYVGSMTAGIVSEVGRTTFDRAHGRTSMLGRRGYEDFIQTDAAINPGNSGGPLVDLTGRVIGINTAIASRSGGFDGIGFAIPASMAEPIFRQLRDTGRVRRGWLGVEIGQAPGGVLISSVFAKAPAAGVLLPGDVVQSVDGHPTSSEQELRNYVASVPPGNKVELAFTRNGTSMTESVTLGELPDNMLSFDAPTVRPEALSPEMLGLVVVNADEGTLRDLGFSSPPTGAAVAAVRPQSLAAQAGVRPNMVIVAVDGVLIETVSDFDAALDDADLSAGISLTVATPSREQILTIRP